MVGLEEPFLRLLQNLLGLGLPATSPRQASAGRPPASATTAVETSGGTAIRRPVDVHVSTSPSYGGVRGAPRRQRGRGPRRTRRPTSAGSLGPMTRRGRAGRPDARTHAGGSDEAFRPGSSLWVPRGGAAAQAQRRTALYPAKAVASPCSARTAPGFPSRLGDPASIGYIQA